MKDYHPRRRFAAGNSTSHLRKIQPFDRGFINTPAEHLRALAQRVEVAKGEVRIMGSKGDLLRTLAVASGVKSATSGVRSSVLKWRRGWDSNP
jgi:hypothetical protein